MDAIVKAYQNDNPNDDPSLFVMAKKKWGPDNIICQGCHQIQGYVWSEEEKKNPSFNENALPPAWVDIDKLNLKDLYASHDEIIINVLGKNQLSSCSSFF